MAKRSKRPIPVWREEEVPPLLRRLYRLGKPGEPHYIPVVDRAFWLSLDQRPWVDALEQLDKLGNKEPLLTLLRSENELPEVVRRTYLTDLIERGVPKPKHRSPTPAYDRTEAEQALIIAWDYVRAYQASGMSFQNSVAKAAKDRSMDEDESKLANFCQGRGGTARRVKKRSHP